MGKVSYDAQRGTRSLLDFDGPESVGNKNSEKKTEEIVEKIPIEDIEKMELTGDKNFDNSYVFLKSEKAKFEKERLKLREYFKKLKVGMIKWEEIPRNYQALLERYYGCAGDENGKEKNERKNDGRSNASTVSDTSGDEGEES